MQLNNKGYAIKSIISLLIIIKKDYVTLKGGVPNRLQKHNIYYFSDNIVCSTYFISTNGLFSSLINENQCLF